MNNDFYKCEELILTYYSTDCHWRPASYTSLNSLYSPKSHHINIVYLQWDFK